MTNLNNEINVELSNKVVEVLLKISEVFPNQLLSTHTAATALRQFSLLLNEEDNSVDLEIDGDNYVDLLEEAFNTERLFGLANLLNIHPKVLEDANRLSGEEIIKGLVESINTVIDKVSKPRVIELVNTGRVIPMFYKKLKVIENTSVGLELGVVVIPNLLALANGINTLSEIMQDMSEANLEFDVSDRLVNGFEDAAEAGTGIVQCIEDKSREYEVALQVQHMLADCILENSDSNPVTEEYIAMQLSSIESTLLEIYNERNEVLNTKNRNIIVAGGQVAVIDSISNISDDSDFDNNRKHIIDKSNSDFNFQDHDSLTKYLTIYKDDLSKELTKLVEDDEFEKSVEFVSEQEAKGKLPRLQYFIPRTTLCNCENCVDVRLALSTVPYNKDNKRGFNDLLSPNEIESVTNSIISRHYILDKMENKDQDNALNALLSNLSSAGSPEQLTNILKEMGIDNIPPEMIGEVLKRLSKGEE